MGTSRVIKKDVRSQLKLPELGTLEARAMTPLADKFTLLSLGENDNQLSYAYSINMRLVEMTRLFKRFDIQDVFYIVKTTGNAADGTLEAITSPTPLYLLDNCAKISMADFCQSTRFFQMYEQDYHIHNLECNKQPCSDEL